MGSGVTGCMREFLRFLRGAFGRRRASGHGQLDGLRLRPMTHHDLGDVLAIESVSFGSPWRITSFGRSVNERHQHFFVAELDGRLVGYAGFWEESDQAHIAKVAVHPDQRRRGIATTLMLHLLAEIVKLGIGRAYLEVRQSNEAAQQLYRRFGFHFERIHANAYPNDGEDACVFVRAGLLGDEPAEPAEP